MTDYNVKITVGEGAKVFTVSIEANSPEEAVAEGIALAERQGFLVDHAEVE